VLDSRDPSPLLREFLLHLASERGLADNSIAAYRRDLEDTGDFLHARRRSLANARADDLRMYLQHQTRLGRSTRTVARRLAALRVFYRFLASQGRDTVGILQHLE
jgi:integrase/recombinase XerD